ncbi:hypothetical protein ACFQGA_02705 [Marinobacter koreensis]|uniref:DUF306 domain-containing protein n=1 Tax=Marinobacter koreensis TaxID=335974 RepID=A0ABW0RNX3_9GAMM|nr:hypothetical protein [Marinobacter koreensis]MCK7547912.1 hypothetical protein [Marinobacter koreensis]
MRYSILFRIKKIASYSNIAMVWFVFLLLAGCNDGDSGDAKNNEIRSKASGIWELSNEGVCGAALGCTTWFIVTEEKYAYQIFHANETERSQGAVNYPNLFWAMGKVKIENNKIEFELEPEESKVYISGGSVRSIVPAISVKGFDIVSENKLITRNSERKVLNPLDDLYRKSASLEGISGIYVNFDGDRTITVNSSGELTGASSPGCNIYGKLTMPDPRFNLFEVKIISDSCISDGSKEGLVILNEKHDALDFSYIGDGSFSGRYNKQ